MIETSSPRPDTWPPYYAVPQSVRGSGRQQARTWDLVLAVLLYCGAAVLGLVAAYFTLFFAFATDPCTQDNCRTEYLTWAFVVSWGGTALALLGSLALLVVAAVKRWYLWFWPVSAILLIIGSFFGGAALAAQVYIGP
ncbi:hypothetical protein OHB12_24320 [Nocardia sp. NBC_01730]|uniref:hypothetical protein n=1 Tax=Nocardia sp. NBC_01730 TaxID=2975998 RepID=UPI002E0D114F|nr:hypothetical protein OHB12_24320 [Nocardia sp. NBC_01730]